MTPVLRLGTRASALALAQSGQIADGLRLLGHAVELVPLTTPGDQDAQPLAGRANEGIFVSSVRDALREGTIDLAVHSYKDLPTDEVAGIVIAAVPLRADPRDVVISRSRDLHDLPSGSVVGTCSVRRAAWVHRARPDLIVAPIRGNIDQRIQRVIAGEFDAIILAAAGLHRLGCATPASYVIAVDDLVPAPAQGALALECRASDTATRLRLQALDHVPTHLSATAERAVLATVDPTDGTAVGAVATMRGSLLSLLVDVSEPDGSGRSLVRTSTRLHPIDHHAAHAAGIAAAQHLMERVPSRAIAS